jgi:hypothetical protein
MRDYALITKAQISWESKVLPALKWGYIAGSLIELWISRLSEWQAIVIKSENLVALYEKHAITLGYHDLPILPTEVETATAEYGIFIGDMIATQLVNLDSATHNMEGLKQTFIKTAEKGVLREERTPSKQIDFIERKILSLRS